jgi:hypothetical protein
MLTIPVEIRKSEIHGYGVFALTDIRRDAVVWMFHPGLDRRISELAIKFCEPRAQLFIRQRGYINPKIPEEIVLCMDEAQFLNFPRSDQPANLCLGGVQDGEHMLLAAIDIPAGDELTVPPESDADYQKKMEAHGAGQ